MQELVSYTPLFSYWHMQVLFLTALTHATRLMCSLLLSVVLFIVRTA